ncbi:response regulator [Herbaspirillum lusitanum]|uniref:histidine kinase n=1 Tax=Herbaspirillum lusitanum TaxID=213312 RepID=A0ABW9A8G0_9BURK
MLLLSVVISFALLAVLGIVQWRELQEQARLSAERAAVVAREHADKVFELDASLNARIEELLGVMDDAQIRADEKSIHAKLQRMISGLPQIIAVAVIGQKGDLLAHSRDYPAPAVSIADRNDFIAIRQGGGESISSVMVGRQVTQALFNDSVARRSESGEFLGMILVSLDPDYFLSFYKEMLPGLMHQSLSLVRKDGYILVRYPKLINAVPKVPPGAPFMRGISQNPLFGTVSGSSPLDGDNKIISYRRVTNHDVYVVSARSLSEVWRSWFQYMSLAAALLLVPSALLWAIIIFAIRRVRDQKIAWQRWQQEVALRHKIESDLRESQKFDALGKLLGRVAHDFNNCLMVIATGMQIIRLKRVPAIEKQIDAIERSIKSGEQLTRQLLGVSRRQPLKPEVFALQTKISEWQLLLFNTVGAHRCSIEVAPDTWPVCVDAVEMQLALINILVNARDASNADGRIALHIENVRRPGDARMQEHFVCISIADQGTGMSEETRTQAFDPLFTTKEAGKGTGLGLSQVRNFARTAGGHVLIESTLGSGTRVSIYLPPAEGVPLNHADAPAAPQIRPLDILLVEDNLDVAEGIVALLESVGHSITHLSNALDAEEFLAHQRVDAVISDIHMPGGITGIALAKKLHINFPALPVILISGYAEDLQAAVNAGFSVISKPFTLESINLQLAAQVK